LRDLRGAESPRIASADLFFARSADTRASERRMACKVLSVAAVALLGLAGQASAGSTYVAKLCRGQTCTDPRFPILEYDPFERKCTCSAHPCWEDNGNTHYCSSSTNPYLEFSYTSDKRLVCRCLDRPFYNAKHILRDLCPGHNCDERTDHPVMDYDERQRKCFCRSHPCTDLDGVEHSCPADRVLRYREDDPETPGGKAKGICECIPKMDSPHLSTDL